MFGITNYVKLDKKSQKNYVIFSVILFICFLMFCCLFAKKLVFPSYEFNFNASIDSLANTISRPHEIQKETSFDVFANGDFDTAHIWLKLSEELPQNTEIAVQKSYKAFLSPISTGDYSNHKTPVYETSDKQYLKKENDVYELISKNAFDSYLFKEDISLSDSETSQENISGLTGFAPGTLISSKTGVFVTDADTKHAFQDELVFKSLGYNFDNVLEANSEELSMHKKAKMFDIKSTHPFGTMFFARDTNKIYIFDTDSLHQIENSETSQQHAIIADEKSRDTFSNCTLEKTFFPPNTYKCDIALNEINRFNGNTFQFTISNVPAINIQKTQITFSTKINENTISQRIEELKKEFTKFYTE